MIVNRKWMLAAAFVVIAGGAIGMGVLAAHWPFTRAQMQHRLEQDTSSTVTIEGFQQTFFPHPGCILDHVQFKKPYMKVDKLIVQGSYSGLLANSVDEIRAVGLYVRLPQQMEPIQPRPGTRHSVVHHFVADGAVLEIDSSPAGQAPLHFTIRELSGGPVKDGEAIRFHSVLNIPKPPGEVRADGLLGPLSAQFGRIPVSGKYSCSKEDLSIFTGLSGLIASSGTFQGRMDLIEVKGNVDVPDFEVTRSHHETDVKAAFEAAVNGTNGDVLLRSVDTRFRQSAIQAGGTVNGKSGQPGKTAELAFSSDQARIEDLLRLVLKAAAPPLTGKVRFRAKAILPPGKEKFMQKIVFEADFGIGGGRFTNAATQLKVDQLSEKASGEPGEKEAETVISNLKGHVALRDGVAHLSNLSFNVPGASALMHGTFNMLTEQVDLHGTLAMAAELSETTTGFKSVFLKVVDPFFKKKHHGAVVPVKITGTYSHPLVGTDILGQK